jgi:hypothetical protein
MIFADMLNERIDCAVSVTRWILDLGADLAEGLAFPSHFMWREMPNRVARHAGGVEVRLQVADRTAHRRESKPVSAALHRWLVEPRHIALARTVAGRMAVETAWMRQHLAQFREYRRRGAAASPMDEKLSTLARPPGGVSDTACAANMIDVKAMIEAKAGIHRLSCMLGRLLSLALSPLASPMLRMQQ